MVCQDCGAVLPVLQSEVIKGPKAQPDPVLGVPKTKTFTDVVEPFKKRSA